MIIIRIWLFFLWGVFGVSFRIGVVDNFLSDGILGIGWILGMEGGF